MKEFFILFNTVFRAELKNQVKMTRKTQKIGGGFNSIKLVEMN